METIKLIIEILILIGIFYMAFFKSYFREKGKNLATKEDVAEITTAVEQIKNEFQYSTQSKLNIKVEERNILIDGYSTYSFYLNTILEARYSVIDNENVERIDQIKNEFDKAKFEFDMAHAKIGLFVNSSTLNKNLGKLTVQTLEFQHIAEALGDKLKGVLFDRKQMLAKTSEDEQLTKYQESLDRYSELLKEYRSEKLKKYKALIILQKEFQNIAYALIKEIVESEDT